MTGETLGSRLTLKPVSRLISLACLRSMESLLETSAQLRAGGRRLRFPQPALLVISSGKN